MKRKENALTKEEIGNKHGLMMHDPIQAHHIGQAMDEYAKQEAIAFLNFKYLNFVELDLGQYVSILKEFSTRDTPTFTTEQLYDLFLQSKKQ